MIYRFTLLLVSSLIVNAKYRLCPNDGQPKTQEDGSLIQCLPGQNSIDVCGKGYSCFFSGFNYQCCPSNEDESAHQNVDCPRGAMAVLDSSGYPVKCSTLGIYCPKKDMFCYDGTESPFCCEYPKKAATEAPIPREAEEFFKDDDEQTLDSKQENSRLTEQLECPAKTLTILGDDGSPLSCQENNQCPHGMYCYGGKAKICCEHGLETATETANLTTTESTSTATTTTAQTSSTTTTSTLTTTIDAQMPVRIHAVKTATKEPTYKQHPNGGYSYQNQPRINKEVEKKELAQHYLLDEIKRGWPYDDRYYRPENMITVKQNGSTAAFVHFN